jgi:hypothetical protein
MKYYNCPQTDELYVKYDKIIELPMLVVSVS